MYKAGMLLDIDYTMYTKKCVLVGMPSTSRPLWSHNEHLYIVMYKAGMLLGVTLKTLIEALVHNTVEM